MIFVYKVAYSGILIPTLLGELIDVDRKDPLVNFAFGMKYKVICMVTLACIILCFIFEIIDFLLKSYLLNFDCQYI